LSDYTLTMTISLRFKKNYYGGRIILEILLSSLYHIGLTDQVLDLPLFSLLGFLLFSQNQKNIPQKHNIKNTY
nr:hypothetical protein [Campylobacterota bacterium]